MMEKLFSKEHVIPTDFSQENEELYFSLLKAQNLGKGISNLSEYLLETEGMAGQSKVMI